ncbi:hypothetical protein CYPRO_1067 [Cyclonatronum proteinivorum]|uniref:Uncharacterized protein n=1 Tax=Cyclonatronum proteinivorum TaxID=1457365 RepID=A0A345UIN0_9BACT|nr:hypothetical protein CYPRO_1067 [Cyclonatronum proteinivorum]
MDVRSVSGIRHSASSIRHPASDPPIPKGCHYCSKPRIQPNKKPRRGEIIHGGYIDTPSGFIGCEASFLLQSYHPFRVDGVIVATMKKSNAFILGLGARNLSPQLLMFTEFSPKKIKARTAKTAGLSGVKTGSACLKSDLDAKNSKTTQKSALCTLHSALRTHSASKASSEIHQGVLLNVMPLMLCGCRAWF